MSADIILSEYGPVSKNLNVAKLSDLCVDKIGVQTGPFGSQLHNEDYVEVGTPIITVEHLGENRIGHLNTPLVSNEDRNRLSRYHLKEGDIVFSRVGSVDRRALVRKEEDGWLFSGRCLRVRVDKKKIDPVYLSYFFGLEGFKNYIRSIAVGATMPSINTKILSDVPIYYPELSEQKKIAEILYVMDEKIELNRQTNQTLEQIAQAIFKSWFVDFDPVKAKIAAKQMGQNPELSAMCAISGKTAEQLKGLDEATLQQLKTTAALFPVTLVESELGEIPEGWDASKLGDHFKVVMGQSPNGDTYNKDGNGTLFFQGRRDFGFRFPTPRVYTTKPKRFAQAGDTLISVRAPVGDKNLALEEYCLGRGVAGIRHKLGSRSFTYSFVSYIEKNLSNSGSDGTVFNSINKNELNAVSFIVPTDELINHFEKTMFSLDQRIEVLSKEIDSLEKLRDALLPKLLSGEICFNKAQAKTESMA